MSTALRPAGPAVAFEFDATHGADGRKQRRRGNQTEVEGQQQKQQMQMQMHDRVDHSEPAEAQASKFGNTWLGDPASESAPSSITEHFIRNFLAARRHRELTDFEISRLEEQTEGMRNIIQVLDPPERQVRRMRAHGGSTLRDEFDMKIFSRELSPFATHGVKVLDEFTELPRDDGSDDASELLHDAHDDGVASFESSSAARSQRHSTSYASDSTGSPAGAGGVFGPSAILKDKQARDRERFENDPQLQFEFAVRHMGNSSSKLRVQRTLAHYYFMQKDTRRLRRKMRQLEREAAQDQSRVPLTKRPLSAPIARPSQPPRNAAQRFPVARPVSALPGRHAQPRKRVLHHTEVGSLGNWHCEKENEGGNNNNSSSSSSSGGGSGSDGDGDDVAATEAKRQRELLRQAKASLFGPAKTSLAPGSKSDYGRILQQQAAELDDLRKTDKEYRAMVSGLESNTKRLHATLDRIVAGTRATAAASASAPRIGVDRSFSQ